MTRVVLLGLDGFPHRWIRPDVTPRMWELAATGERVGKRKVELSNLTKVLFPDDHIVKAQLIEYYLKIAPTIDAHTDAMFNSIVDSFPGANVIIYTPEAEKSLSVAQRFDSLFLDYNKTAEQKSNTRTDFNENCASCRPAAPRRQRTNG